MSNENKTMQIVMPDVPDTIPSQEHFVYVCLPDVDAEMSSTSENPVQNKVIAKEFEVIKKTLEDKVDAEDGKALSSNDYSDADRDKVHKLVEDGSGDKYLSDDGNYKELPNSSVVNGEAASSAQLKDAGNRAITKGKRGVNFGGYNEVLQPASIANGYQNTNNGKYGEVGGQRSYTAFDNAIAKGKGVAALVKNAVVYGSSNQENNSLKIAASYLIVGATKDNPKDFSAVGNAYKEIKFENFNGVNTYTINDNGTKKVLADYIEELWDSLPAADKIQVGAAENSLTVGSGNLNLLLNGYVGGANNKGKGTGGTIKGTGNRVVGDNCDVNGDANNSTGDEAFINGYRNVNNGNFNKILGNNNNINASYCFTNGDGNICNFNHCNLSGIGLIADKVDQTIIGKYNAPSNADFVIASGYRSYDETVRANALEVYKKANGVELKVGNTLINESQLQALLALI